MPSKALNISLTPTHRRKSFLVLCDSNAPKPSAMLAFWEPKEYNKGVKDRKTPSGALFVGNNDETIVWDVLLPFGRSGIMAVLSGGNRKN